MALFEVKPLDREIYEKELRDFLPDKIIDIHAHVWKEEIRQLDAYQKGRPQRTITWSRLVARDNPVEDLQETYRLLFPGKEVKALIFANGGQPGPNNQYIQQSSAVSGFPALYWTEPTMTADEMEQGIRDGGFLGVKAYLNSAPNYIPGNEIRIFDFIPKHQLERLNRMGAIMMLHIPRNGRLQDPVNIAQIMEIKELYPNVKLIVAHIGRAYTQKDVGNAFETLDKAPTLLYDFSANCCEYAIKEAIAHAGVKHVMFGTDMPILRMRTHRIEKDGIYVNMVPAGLYGDVSYDPNMGEVTGREAEKITFFIYEELLAFKRAAQTLGLTKQDVEDIMYNNALRVLEEARSSIYGRE